MAAFGVHSLRRMDRSRAAALLSAAAAAVFVFVMVTGGGRRLRSALAADGPPPPPPLFCMLMPKVASTSLGGLLGRLARRNAFRLTEVRWSPTSMQYGGPGEPRRLDAVNRRAVARLLEGKAAVFGYVAFYHIGHYRPDARPPAMVSVMRAPLSRFASNYYYTRCRTTDLDVPIVIDWAWGNGTDTLDECVRSGSRRCDQSVMWHQVAYFCGQAPQCWQVGNEWALSEAKHNLANHFLLVGLTEQMDKFVQLMQIILPQYFDHADEYLQDEEVMRANPGGDCKKEMSPSTKAAITKWPAYQMERELYRFAAEIFADTYKRTMVMSSAGSDDLIQLDFHSITT